MCRPFYGEGVDGIYVCGNTGEGLLLPVEMREQSTEIAVRSSIAACKQIMTWRGIPCGHAAGPRRQMTSDEVTWLRTQLETWGRARLKLKLPAFAEGWADVLIGFGAVREAQIFTIPFQFARNAEGDDAE